MYVNVMGSKFWCVVCRIYVSFKDCLRRYISNYMGNRF